MDVDDILLHYGVKGMQWGVRKDRTNGYRSSSGPTIDSTINSSARTASKEVAALISDRYGFDITAVRDLKASNPAEYNFGTIGLVMSTPGKRGGEILLKPENVAKDLKDAEVSGWFGEGTGNIKALVTHETAHAMFHADQSVKSGFFKVKTTGGDIEARDKALKTAVKEARKEGIPPRLFSSRVSGYAQAAGVREELEAEMFSQYHWSPNPPNFVKAWGETLHNELGVDSTPFGRRK